MAFLGQEFCDSAATFSSFKQIGSRAVSAPLEQLSVLDLENF